MNKTEFTEGPWEVECDEEYGNHTIRMGTAIEDRGSFEPQHVVEYEHGCWFDKDSEEDCPANKQAREAEANANLMAASPDMYKALSEILTRIANVPLDKNVLTIITLCERAIVKAGGIE